MKDEIGREKVSPIPKKGVTDKGDAMKQAIQKQRCLAIHEKFLNKKLEKRAELAKSVAQAKTQLRKLEPQLAKTEVECDAMAKKCVQVRGVLYDLVQKLNN